MPGYKFLKIKHIFVAANVKTDKTLKNTIKTYHKIKQSVQNIHGNRD